jgi:hypothetical protein
VNADGGPGSTCSRCGANAPAHQSRLVGGKTVPLCPFCITGWWDRCAKPVASIRSHVRVPGES